MKLKIKQSYSVRGTFVIRNEQGELIAREVSPELAAWVVAKARENTHQPCLCGAQSNCCDIADAVREVQFGPPLTADCEVEI